MSHLIRFASFLAASIAITTPIFAQLPSTRLDGVFPAGAAPGAVFELTVSGTNLDDVDRLLFSHEGITFVRKMAEPTPSARFRNSLKLSPMEEMMFRNGLRKMV
jgi:hypothetical protein